MLKIRRYQPQDNKVIRELNIAARAQMMIPDATLIIPNLDADFDNIEEVYLRHGDFIVGLEDGEIVAVGAFKRRTATCAEFKRLRIRPDCQRKGYGEAIMRELMKRAAEMGYIEGFLDTLTTNIAAQRLFEKLGFIKSGSDKIGPYDIFQYARKLNKGGQ